MKHFWFTIFEIAFLCALAQIATSLVFGIWVGVVVYFSLALVGFYTNLQHALNDNGFLEKSRLWDIHYDYE